MYNKDNRQLTYEEKVFIKREKEKIHEKLYSESFTVLSKNHNYWWKIIDLDNFKYTNIIKRLKNFKKLNDKDIKRDMKSGKYDQKTTS